MAHKSTSAMRLPCRIQHTINNTIHRHHTHHLAHMHPRFRLASSHVCQVAHSHCRQLQTISTHALTYTTLHNQHAHQRYGNSSQQQHRHSFHTTSHSHQQSSNARYQPNNNQQPNSSPSQTTDRIDTVFNISSTMKKYDEVYRRSMSNEQRKHENYQRATAYQTSKQMQYYLQQVEHNAGAKYHLQRLKNGYPSQSYPEAGAMMGSYNDVYKHMILTNLLQEFEMQNSPWTYINVLGGATRYDIAPSWSRGKGIDAVYLFGRHLAARGIREVRQRFVPPFAALIQACRMVNAFGQPSSEDGSVDLDDTSHPTNDDLQRAYGYLEAFTITEGDTQRDRLNKLAALPKLQPNFRYYPGHLPIVKRYMKSHDRVIYLTPNELYYQQNKEFIGDDRRFTILHHNAYYRGADDSLYKEQHDKTEQWRAYQQQRDGQHLTRVDTNGNVWKINPNVGVGQAGRYELVESVNTNNIEMSNPFNENPSESNHQSPSSQPTTSTTTIEPFTDNITDDQLQQLLKNLQLVGNNGKALNPTSKEDIATVQGSSWERLQELYPPEIDTTPRKPQEDGDETVLQNEAEMLEKIVDDEFEQLSITDKVEYLQNQFTHLVNAVQGLLTADVSQSPSQLLQSSSSLLGGNSSPNISDGMLSLARTVNEIKDQLHTDDESKTALQQLSTRIQRLVDTSLKTIYQREHELANQLIIAELEQQAQPVYQPGPEQYYDTVSALAKPLTSTALVHFEIGTHESVDTVGEQIRQVGKELFPRISKQIPHAMFLVTYPIYGRSYPDGLVSDLLSQGHNAVLHSYYFPRQPQHRFATEAAGVGVIIVNPPLYYENVLKKLETMMDHVVEAAATVSDNGVLADDETLEALRAQYYPDTNLKQYKELERHQLDAYTRPPRPSITYLHEKDTLYSNVNNQDPERFSEKYALPDLSPVGYEAMVQQLKDAERKQRRKTPKVDHYDRTYEEYQEEVLTQIPTWRIFGGIPRIEGVRRRTRADVQRAKKEQAQKEERERIRRVRSRARNFQQQLQQSATEGQA